MILPIYTYGQAVLREETKPIDSSYPELQQLIADMFETMYNADGIGLAAPQIGRSIKLLVIDGTPLANDHLDCKDFKRVLINPEIVEESPERVTYEEGCLSFPGVHERVTRAERIRVKYLNERFEPVEEPIRRQLNKAKLNNIIKGKASCRYRIKPANKK